MVRVRVRRSRVHTVGGSAPCCRGRVIAVAVKVCIRLILVDFLVRLGV